MSVGWRCDFDEPRRSHPIILFHPASPACRGHTLSHTHTHTLTHTHTHAHTLSFTQALIHTHTLTHTHTQAHILVWQQGFIQIQSVWGTAVTKRTGLQRERELGKDRIRKTLIC